VSKERARRRAEREREAAIRAAARAAQAARRERQQARRRALRNLTPSWTSQGTHTGVLARRARVRAGLVLAGVVAVNVLVWVVRADWPARLAALVVTALVAPVFLLLRRR
jgi:Flp pilus assembly protein TadB